MLHSIGFGSEHLGAARQHERQDRRKTLQSGLDDIPPVNRVCMIGRVGEPRATCSKPARSKAAGMPVPGERGREPLGLGHGS